MALADAYTRMQDLAARGGKPAKIVATCAHCHFSRAPQGSDVLCQRYPPSLIPEGAAWPVVGSDNWCGEWRPKL
jgi:hypothetical protein